MYVTYSSFLLRSKLFVIKYVSIMGPPFPCSTVCVRRPYPQNTSASLVLVPLSKVLMALPFWVWINAVALVLHHLLPVLLAGVCHLCFVIVLAHHFFPDPFVMYIVDVNKPAGGIDAPPPPPPQPEYPSPPPNAIPFTNNGSQIPVYYNQTVVLQCLTSGVVSPVLIIRKVDHQTTVVGGGLQEGAKGVADHYCAPGEVCGDPVSQLHKIAFEVYDASKGLPEPGTPGATGAFLSCMGEKVNTYRPIEGRQWNSSQGGSSSPIMPGSPISSAPTAGGEYFAHGPGSAPASPSSAGSDFLSNDGGRVKKKRSTSSAGGVPKAMKGRRRPSSAESVTSSRRGSSSDSGATSGALWQVDIGETSVWTIVGTGQFSLLFTFAMAELL